MEAIRQLAPENMTAMEKLGATLLTGLTGADAVDLISAGATLDSHKLAALRTILSHATPVALPIVSQMASPAKDWNRVRVTVEPNVLLVMLFVSADGLYWFLEDSRRELDSDS